MESCRNEISQKGGIAMKKYVSRLLAFFTAGALTSAFLPYPSSFVRADEKEAVNEPIELEEYITQTAGKHVTFTNTLERFYPGCDINYIFSLSSDGTLHKYLGNCSETVFMTNDSFDINDLNSELASKEINADIKEVREKAVALLRGRGKIIFTSSGSESDNLALFGCKKAKNSRIIVSASGRVHWNKRYIVQCINLCHQIWSIT